MELEKQLDDVLSRKKAREWALVLHAMSIPYELKESNDEYRLILSDEWRDKAIEQLSLYEDEMNGFIDIKPHQESGKELPIISSLFVTLVFYLFSLWVFTTADLINWFDLGNASSEAILKGAWWQTITALTLHGDMGHLLSNVAILCISGTVLSSFVGTGLSWTLILLSGALGNTLNAVAFQTGHFSIGSSTAVFGSLGILTGIQLFGRFQLRKLRAWLPLGGALGLLAFLGMGINTDISAHVFGIISGLLLGVVCACLFLVLRKPGKVWQLTAGVLSLALIVLCWFKAFNYI